MRGKDGIVTVLRAAGSPGNAVASSMMGGLQSGLRAGSVIWSPTPRLSRIGIFRRTAVVLVGRRNQLPSRMTRIPPTAIHLNCETMHSGIISSLVAVQPRALRPSRLSAMPFSVVSVAIATAATGENRRGATGDPGGREIKCCKPVISQQLKTTGACAGSRRAVRPQRCAADGATPSRGREDYFACPTRIINGTRPPTRC